MKKRYKVIIIVLAFIFVSNSIATKIIYDSVFKRYDHDYTEELSQTEKYSEFISSRDSLLIPEGKDTLQAYFYDCEDEKGLVVMAPGVHSGADVFVPVAYSFCENGYDIIAFDPLGSVGSTGKSLKGFSQEIFDLDAVLDYAESNYPGEDIFLFGHSRGGFAVCGELDSDHDIKAAVAVSAHNTAMDAIISYSARYVGEFANANWPSLWAYQAMIFGPSVVNLRADRIIESSSIPVMIVQGSEDKTAPAKKYSLYSKRSNIGRKGVTYYFSEEEGKNGHTDIMFDGEDANSKLMDSIFDFFEEN